jgi:hypothetical protein
MVKQRDLPGKAVPFMPREATPKPPPVATRGVEVQVRRARQLGLLDLLFSLLAIIGALALALLLWITSGLFTITAIQGAALGQLRGAAFLGMLSASHALLPWIIPAAITAGQLVLWPGSRLARAMAYQFGSSFTFMAALLWAALWLLEIGINYQGIVSTILAQPLDLVWQQVVVTPQMLDPQRSAIPILALGGALLLSAGPEQLLRWAWAALRVLGDDLRGAAGR